MSAAVQTTTAPRIAVLISGEGTNLQALLDAVAAGTIGGRVALVVSDRPQARGLERARQAGVDAVCVRPAEHTGRVAYEAALLDALLAQEPSLLVLAGFMRVLRGPVLERFAGRMLNIHPSLLPSYPGLDTHRRVLEAGERWHGATVHFVTPALDAGPRVIQYRLAVRADDTPETLAARVHVGEHIILPRAVGWFVDGRLAQRGDQAVLDGRPLAEPVTVEAGT